MLTTTARHRYPLHTVFPSHVNSRGIQTCTPFLLAPLDWSSTNATGGPKPVWTVEFMAFHAIFIDAISKDEVHGREPHATVKDHLSVPDALAYLDQRCESGHYACELRHAEMKYQLPCGPAALPHLAAQALNVRGDVHAFYTLNAMPGGTGLYFILSGALLTQHKSHALVHFSRGGGELKVALTIREAVQAALRLRTFQGVPMDQIRFVLDTGYVCGEGDAPDARAEVEEIQPFLGCDVYVCENKTVATNLSIEFLAGVRIE
ncbi:hypothetical protein DFH07DRAFT_958246 [Mycena maculata]|uniref:Uncharacterized protein n=1 Tax=Mycena maculata TaxID=230809 RepID=A0AAD7J857_9AGAR|nr:hypothetical protein DFH07DRAFT_958246 [Mycena maculata]